MKKLLGLLRPLLELNIRSPWWVIGLAFLLSGVAAFLATGLKVDTDLANLLPKDHPAVLALDRMQATLGGETALQVAIRSPEFDRSVAFADSLIARALKLHDDRKGAPFFKRAEFRRDTDVLRDNALWLATGDELDRITRYLEDEVQKAKEDANPFFFDLFEDEEFAEEDADAGEVASAGEELQLDAAAGQDFGDGGSGGSGEPGGSGGSGEGGAAGDDLSDFRETYDRIIPTEYPVNEDSTLIVIQLYPSGSKSDLRYLEEMFSALDTLIASMEPSAWHPEMEVRFGGRLKRHLNELDSVMSDVFRSFTSGISSVVLLVVLYFLGKTYMTSRHQRRAGRVGHLYSQLLRSPVAMLVIGVPLLMSLFMTFGLTWLFVDSLNTMTAVLFVILFGLGIDYGIHFYARYIEMRGSGEDVGKAVRSTFETSGQAIVASALTTASALFILVVADFRGFSEFGLISGIGILLALACMLLVLPAILVVLERGGLIFDTRDGLLPAKAGVSAGDTGFSAAGDGLSAVQASEAHGSLVPGPDSGRPARFPFAGGVLLAGLLLTLAVIWRSPSLEFEYEFGKLEPEFPDYVDFRRFSSGVDEDNRRNPAYILAESDEEIFEIVDSLRARKAANPSTTIGDVEALAERFPTTEEAKASKLTRIARIRELLQDPFIVNQDNEDLDLLRETSRTTTPLSEADLPEFIKNRFLTRDGEIGTFVVVYPSVGLSDGRNSIAFKNEVGEIPLSTGRTAYAASTSIVAAEMLDLMRRESPYMVSATFAIVFLFMLWTFRSFRWSLMAALPLIVGLLMLFGIMLLIDFRFNFYNLVVLPAILGIGCDNGIHIASRYREEGPGSLREVLRSTGQHITIGSLTTMLGFGGLLFTSHPGLRSIGEIAVIGIGMALLVALTFLPALVQWLQDRSWIRW